MNAIYMAFRSVKILLGFQLQINQGDQVAFMKIKKETKSYLVSF